MAIFDMTAYGAQCDRCKEVFEGFEGYSLWIDKDSALLAAKEQDWVEYEGKLLCPKCLFLQLNEEIAVKLIEENNNKEKKHV